MKILIVKSEYEISFFFISWGVVYKTHFFLPKFDQKGGYILYIGTKFFPFFFQSTFLNTAGVLLMISHVMWVVWVYNVYLTSRISSLIWILFPSIRILILSDMYLPFHNQPPSDYAWFEACTEAVSEACTCLISDFKVYLGAGRLSIIMI